MQLYCSPTPKTQCIYNRIDFIVTHCYLTQIKVYPYHINDVEFANAIVDSFLEINKKNGKEFSPQIAVAVSIEDSNVATVPTMGYSSFEATIYSPSDFPDAHPGDYLITLLFCQIRRVIRLILMCCWKFVFWVY